MILCLTRARSGWVPKPLPLASRQFPLPSSNLCVFKHLRTPFHGGQSASRFLPITSALFSSRRRGYPSLAMKRVRRSEEHTSELQSHLNLLCPLLLDKKKNITIID